MNLILQSHNPESQTPTPEVFITQAFRSPTSTISLRPLRARTFRLSSGTKFRLGGDVEPDEQDDSDTDSYRV